MSVEGEHNVVAINFKLTPFWPSYPLVWFVVVKAQFATSGISSQKIKFDYIYTSVAPKFPQEVSTRWLRHIQHLLGEKANATGTCFLCELFLQKLPTNVCIILASADSKDLDDLAQIANKVMEVVHFKCSDTTEIDQLHSEIADFKHLVQSLLPSKTPNKDDLLVIVHPTLPYCNLQMKCVGIITFW